MMVTQERGADIKTTEADAKIAGDHFKDEIVSVV